MRKSLFIISCFISLQVVQGVSIGELANRLNEFERAVNEIAENTDRAEASSVEESTSDGQEVSDQPVIEVPTLPNPLSDANFSEPGNRHQFPADMTPAKELMVVVEEITGEVTLYDDLSDTFIPVTDGYKIEKSVLLVVSVGSSMIVSFPGRISSLVSENSRIVLGPPQNGNHNAYLRNGTISVLMDPVHDSELQPFFTVHTLNGSVQATNSFFAVTKYKGMASAMVKHGEVIKKTTLPTKPNFSSYLSGGISALPSGN